MYVLPPEATVREEQLLDMDEFNDEVPPVDAMMVSASTCEMTKRAAISL